MSAAQLATRMSTTAPGSIYPSMYPYQLQSQSNPIPIPVPIPVPVSGTLGTSAKQFSCLIITRLKRNHGEKLKKTCAGLVETQLGFLYSFNFHCSFLGSSIFAKVRTSCPCPVKGIFGLECLPFHTVSPVFLANRILFLHSPFPRSVFRLI